MLKIKVFKKNTPWGVIRKADGSLIYQHVINFPDETKKDEFVFNYLLTDEEQNSTTVETWKTDLLTPIPEQTVTTINEQNITLKVTPANTKFNFIDLKKADFAIIERNGEYEYYALKLNNITYGIFNFECEIDIFFTYKIKFRPNTLNYVNRAHLNRLTDDGTSFKKPWNFPELLYSGEDLQVTQVRQQLIGKRKNTYNPYSTPPPNLQWMAIYTNLPDTDNGMKFFNNNQDKSNSPYTILVIPFIKASSVDTFVNLHVYRPSQLQRNQTTGIVTLLPNQTPNESFTFNAFKTYEKFALGSLTEGSLASYTLKIEIMNECPFYFLNNITKTEYASNKVYFFDYEIVTTEDSITTNLQMSTETANNAFGYKRGSVDGAGSVFYVNNVNGPTEKAFVVREENPNTAFKYINFLQDFIDDDMDPKFYTSEITKFFLKNFYEEYFFYDIELFYDPSKFYIYTNLAFDNTSQVFYMDQKERRNLLGGLYMEDNVNSSLPVQSNLKADYLLGNATQIKNRRQMLNVEKKYSQASAVTSGISNISSGINTLNPIAGISSAISVGGNIAGSALKYEKAAAVHTLENEKIDAKLTDLKNQAQPIKLSGEKFFEQFSLRNNEVDINFGLLLPAFPIQDQILERFNKYGYNLNKELALSTIIETRKFWNYVHAQNVFNVLDLRISSPLKQIIGNAFAAGVTLWHYRDAESWQGILSYGRENQETNWNKNKKKKKNKNKLHKLKKEVIIKDKRKRNNE